MLSRFVILHHKTTAGEHWDLMLQRGEALLTWQLFREPTDRLKLPIPARRIADHRKAYLDYEGPVGEDRGCVERVDTGTVNILELTSTKCLFDLDGRRLSGGFRLTKSIRGGWRLEAAEP